MNTKQSTPPRHTPKPRAELLALAEQCGAMLTGKPDGSESITVVFTIEAWRTFDAALGSNAEVRGSSVPLDCSDEFGITR